MTGSRPPSGVFGLGGAEKKYKDDDCSMIMEMQTPQLVVTRVIGYARRPLVDFYLREIIAFSSLAERRIDIFHDWWEVTSFEPEARQTFMKWGEERRELNKKLMRQVHILSSSTMVFLALGAARIIYGSQLDVHRTREGWEDALRDAKRSPSTDPVR